MSPCLHLIVITAKRTKCPPSPIERMKDDFHRRARHPQLLLVSTAFFTTKKSRLLCLFFLFSWLPLPPVSFLIIVTPVSCLFLHKTSRSCPRRQHAQSLSRCLQLLFHCCCWCCWRVGVRKTERRILLS